MKVVVKVMKMSEHIHKYEVTKGSVFGLVHVHAVMRCTGVNERKPCGAKLTKVIPYSDLEKKGNKRPKYFYQEK